MNVAVVGSSGYIAGFLMKRFRQEPSVGRILRIDQTGDVDAYLNLLEADKFDYGQLTGIDYVVFTAAISAPDQCAEAFDLCWRINVEGTKFFINEAIARGCRVLFFSSDAVFGDIPGKIYDEDSETEAETAYGRMKKAVEDEFRANSSFKAIRLSYVASPKDRFISYCLSCIEKGEVADIFHPFYRNVIVVSDVVDVVVWFLHHWNEYPSSVLNVAGKELVSRVRMADELNRLFDDRLRYTISTPDDGFYNNRPKITQMRSLYLNRYHILEDNLFTEKIKKEFGGQ